LLLFTAEDRSNRYIEVLFHKDNRREAASRGLGSFCFQLFILISLSHFLILLLIGQVRDLRVDEVLNFDGAATSADRAALSTCDGGLGPEAQVEGVAGARGAVAETAQFLGHDALAVVEAGVAGGDLKLLLTAAAQKRIRLLLRLSRITYCIVGC